MIMSKANQANDQNKQKEMINNLNKMAKKNSADLIIDEIVKIL